MSNAYSFYQVHWQCAIPEHPAPSTPLTNSGQNGSFFLYLKRARASEELGELPKTSLGMATTEGLMLVWAVWSATRVEY